MGLTVEISKRINGFYLDVGWQMERELVALFGFSGSGKSMTLQLIAGLLKPDTGLIRLGGKVYYDSSKRIDLKPQQRSLGYVLQDYALFPHMSVSKNIAYGLSRREARDREERVAAMTSLLKLDGLEQAKPGEISGGQQQRVALARALIRRPELLMLDEPFSALDRPIRRELQQVIRGLREEFDIPVILVTHDYDEVLALADKVVVYSGGRVAQIGTPGEVLARPANEDVRRLVGAADLPAVGLENT